MRFCSLYALAINRSKHPPALSRLVGRNVARGLGGRMIASLVAFGVVALLTPLATRLLGRRVFPIIALVPAVAFVVLLTWMPGVLAGAPVVEVVPWIPQLGIALSFRIDALALLP